MSDEVIEGATELRNEMMKVNSGSKREGELQQQLNTLYQRAHAPGAAAIPLEGTRPAGDQPMTAEAEAALETEYLAQLQAEREQFGNTTERNRLLDIKIEELLRKNYEGEQSYAPEPGPTPSTVTFAEGTPEPVKNAFCAFALEHGITKTETQEVLDVMKTARWLTPEQFRREMAAEWGEQYVALAALADRTLEQLPFRLRDAVLAREANDSRFSPEVARALIAWAKRPRGG